MIEKIQKDDWVRFRRDGIMVIGVVQYVEHGRWVKIHTDIGEVAVGSIFEVRARSGDRYIRDSDDNDGYFG